MDFSSQYTVLEQRYAEKFGIYNNVDLIMPEFNQENQQSDLVCIRISKMSIYEKVLFKYRTLKYLNILQPLKYYNTQDEYYIIYQNLYQHLLSEQKLKSIIQKEGYRILLQLVLTFAEFQRRQFYWPISSINQFYYIEGIIYFSLLEYDFNNFNKPLNYLTNFWQFFNQYFIYQFQDLTQFRDEESFNKIIEYLFEKNGNIHKQSLLEPYYEKVLQYLLNIDKFYRLYSGNCVVKQFKRNKVFSFQLNLTEDIVYKSTDIKGNDDDKQQILLQIQRDIELMELFTNNENVANCFAYLRIYDYVFLLYRKFIGTLADIINSWSKKDQTLEQIKKDVYVITSRTADSLKILHEKNIIHRDLKPQNIFLDNENLSQSFSYVADFDCSKQIYGSFNLNQTKKDSSYTQKYDPPETTQTLKYDIFQLGLIFLTVANRGKYIGDEWRGPRLLKEDEFDSFYSKKAIQISLSSFNYDSKFIDVIAQCLHRDPNLRPDINTLCNQLMTFKQNLKMKIKSCNVIQQQDQTYQQQQKPPLLKMNTSDFQTDNQQINPQQNIPNQFNLSQPNNQNMDSSPTKSKQNSIKIIQINNSPAQEQQFIQNIQGQQQNIQIFHSNSLGSNFSQQINNQQQQMSQPNLNINQIQSSNKKIKFLHQGGFQ